MPIKNISIAEDCTACGLCGNICPEVFELRDHSTVIAGANYEMYEQKIREAIKCCPVGVISISP